MPSLHEPSFSENHPVPITAGLLLRHHIGCGHLNVVFMVFFLKMQAALLIFIHPSELSRALLSARVQRTEIHGPTSPSSASSPLSYFTSPSTFLAKDEWPHVQILFLPNGQRSWINLKQLGGVSSFSRIRLSLPVQSILSWDEKTKVHFHHHSGIILLGLSSRQISSSSFPFWVWIWKLISPRSQSMLNCGPSDPRILKLFYLWWLRIKCKPAKDKQVMYQIT